MFLTMGAQHHIEEWGDDITITTTMSKEMINSSKIYSSPKPQVCQQIQKHTQ